MSSVITTDFEKWKAQQVAAGKPVVLDEFVFANVPNLDPSKDISRSEKLPAANQIVHRQVVNKTGLASENAVAYSVTLGTEVGHFDFNWIGLINKTSGVIGMITHAPTQKKIRTANGLQGNVLTRSFLLEFDGAATETAITTTAETWQIDFTARLTGMDEMQRLINTDSYGEAAFLEDSFAVVRQGEQYRVKKGLAYIGGLRGMLEFDQTLNSMRNTRVYADFSYQGNLVSQWKTRVKITAVNDLKNYVDTAGYPHYVFAIARIDSNGNVIDLRSHGSLSDREMANMKRELGKIKQDYATKQALESGLNGKQPKGDYATNAALDDVRKNADSRLSKYQNGADIQNKSTFIGNLGLSETVVQARNALPRNSTQSFSSGNHTIKSGGDYCTLFFQKGDGRQAILSTSKHDVDFILSFTYRDTDGTDTVVRVPRRDGVIALTRDIEPAIPIGASFIWSRPLTELPGYNDIFWANEGQRFDPKEYPVAAKIFTQHRLPDDRGYALRMADNGRGIDLGRTVGTYQEDAMQNIKGAMEARYGFLSMTEVSANGAFSVVENGVHRIAGGGTTNPAYGIDFDAARVVPTANEFRMKNVAKILVTRMK
ncbi:phage tail protein [Xenorhabdus sp. KJ12.1]|uniref:phage tail-collar fiber domain-containing protein n=1 Tax=Xenorhabdus sp. KJ12.1 TaxID=1851571 RepID=UPI000C040140|nr:phage tail protein [Xenorhabdus sp. KJ12.1]PHM68259.1 tail fiber protein [Xenorhabdus sp. KJ12.1]